jgi:hypothetical protein
MSNFLTWSTDDVVARLAGLGLGAYGASFRENEISGAVLPLLKEADLRELGLTRVGHRLLFQQFLTTLFEGPRARRTKSKSEHRRKCPAQCDEAQAADSLGRAPCPHCGRRFAADRIARHVEICAEASERKVPAFDSRRNRLVGTSAAWFAPNEPEKPAKRPPTEYKAKHQQLIEALRAARRQAASEVAQAQGKAPNRR